MTIILYVFAVGGLVVLFRLARCWFTACYTIQITDAKLIGWNLWGQASELELPKIYSAQSMWGFLQFRLNADQEKPFIIYGNVDYYGFIMDYIFDRMSPGAKVDKQYLYKLRQMTRFWKYTKQLPGTGWYFQTKYEPGYIEKLEVIVSKQREDLIRRGVLREDAFYGEPTWPKEFAKAKAEGRAWAL